MSDTTNALFNALGAYDSDDGERSDSSSSSAEPMPVDTHSQLPRSAPTAVADENSEAVAITEVAASITEEAELMFEAEYDGVNSDQLAAYTETKRNLDILLGCDTVPDFEPVTGEQKCTDELQEKFQQWHKLKSRGANFNEALMRNKTFRNPNIYRWLVDHLQLEEAGTELPSDGRFDPKQLRKDFSAKSLGIDQERRAREYAARKAAEASAARANGTPRNIQFQSAGYEKQQSPATNNRPHGNTRAHPDNGRGFEDALQRAKLIAQHLARPQK
ncbi:SAP30-binding protein [Coemansia sp. RSA 1822]|nr:SAP30-binding protein [Coemansia sp. RSA 638]KAJ2542704.1 SAP30-binding protein [Coemansia sp. RSA 1853]KAJ2560383.1 SAP30-binding protein [Coemansia sp. RSA 1822]